MIVKPMALVLPGNIAQCIFVGQPFHNTTHQANEAFLDRISPPKKTFDALLNGSRHSRMEQVKFVEEPSLLRQTKMFFISFKKLFPFPRKLNFSILVIQIS